MEMKELQLLNELRGIFFTCLDLESGELQFENVVLKLLNHVKESIDAKEVCFYRYNAWKEKLVCETSTNEHCCQKGVVHYLVVEELEEKLKEHVFLYNEELTDSLKEFNLIIPLKQAGEITGFLAVKEYEDRPLNLPSSSQYCLLATECMKLFRAASNISRIVSQEQRYRQLYRVTEKFHSSMDMDDVLEEIINTLQQVYPTFTYTLLVSYDNNHRGHLPIKDLDYDSENIAAMQAYVTGTIQFENSIDRRHSVLYAPLKGKQGVYGVLKVVSKDTLIFPKSEVEFITLLANTAGSAIENAQLYQQSKRLIADLQLINETSHQLNSNLRLSEIMNYMRKQISKSFKAEVIGFAIYSAEGECKMLQGSSEYFNDRSSNKYLEYVKEKIDKEKEAIFLGDLQLHESENSKYRSVMAVPMMQGEVVKGFALVMHREAYYFSFEMFKLLQSLIHHSTLAVTNSILHEELERMVVTDHLTKLYSRSFLDDKLMDSMNNDQEGTFIMIDIDNFKTINDTFGHQVGDEVLLQVSNAIMKCIRSTDTAARWGGEELAVYLPKVSLEMGVSIAERIRQCVVEETNPSVSVSCGVSHWNVFNEDSIHALFKRADVALYEAKNSGKNKVLIG